MMSTNSWQFLEGKKGEKGGEATRKATHLRAAKIICAFRSRKLASLCFAVVSQVAFPPASSGDFANNSSSVPGLAILSSSLNRSIKEGACLLLAPEEYEDVDAAPFDTEFGLATRVKGSLVRG